MVMKLNRSGTFMSCSRFPQCEGARSETGEEVKPPREMGERCPECGGALVEREGIGESLLRKLGRALKPSTSLIPWIPTRPKRGTVNRRWGVVFNDRPC